MKLTSLRLHNFRNFPSAEFDFSAPLDVIIGPNGSGKSNLLEAVGLLSSGVSFRKAKNKELILRGQNEATVDGVILDGVSSNARLRLALTKSSRQFFLNNKLCSRKEFLARFRTVHFTPRDLDLISGEPGLRRVFLDDVLVSAYPEYAEKRSAYGRVLRQRNRLLTMRPKSAGELEYWNQQLVQLGSYLIEKRKLLVAELNKHLSQWGLKLDYEPSPRSIGAELAGSLTWPQDQIINLFQNKLEQVQDRELELGFSLIGPQRDRLDVFGPAIDSSSQDNLALYGSRGQQRLAVVRLKIAQLAYLKEKLEVNPLLLLDDIFSELDDASRQEVITLLDDQQALVTATAVPKELSGVKVIRLESRL